MQEFTVVTRHSCEFAEITAEINARVPKTLRNGLCHIFCPHTTAGLTVNENADLCVDLFVKKFPAGAQKIIHLVISAAIVAAFAIILYNTWLLFVSQAGNTSIIAKYPLQLRSGALLVGMTTIAIRYAANLVQDILLLFRRDKKEG